MLNRVQLSLIIDDNDVYNNLVIPAKQNKDLHPLCIRLLSAYYYNEEVRNIIDGVSDEDYEEVSESPVMEAINNLRNNLAMQAFLSSDLAKVIEDGAEDIADIATNGGTVNVSNVKVEFSKNQAGNTNVRLLTDSQEEIKPENLTKSASTKGQEPDALFLINFLARKMGIDLADAYNDSSSEVTNNTDIPVVSETVIQTEPEQVVITKQEVIAETNDSMFNEDFTVEEAPITVEEPLVEKVEPVVTEAEPLSEDASGAINDLLSSLLG